MPVSVIFPCNKSEFLLSLSFDHFLQGYIFMNIALLVDIAVIVLLLISAGVSFFRGLIREVLTIVGAVGGGFAALAFGPKLVPLMSKWFGVVEGKPPAKLFDLIPMDVVAQIAAYAGIFVIVFIILQLASHLISSAAQAVGLGSVDRTLGIFFGLARGLLLYLILQIPHHKPLMMLLALFRLLCNKLLLQVFLMKLLHTVYHHIFLMEQIFQELKPVLC
jgi:uncharacterized membrane protein required for colicin V production